MPKYGEKAKSKVKKAMHERKEGTLKSGSGKKVTSKKQAVAIGLSEARKAGGKAPKKASNSKSDSSKSKPGPKKSSASKSSTKSKPGPKKGKTTSKSGAKGRGKSKTKS